jgi:hypothetical protein
MRRVPAGVVPTLVVLVSCGDASERPASVASTAPTAPSATAQARPGAAQVVTGVATTEPLPTASGTSASNVDEPQRKPITRPEADLLAAVEVPQGSRVGAEELRAAIEARRVELRSCLKADSAADVVAKVTSSGSLQDVRITRIQPEDLPGRDCLALVLKQVHVANVSPGQPSPVALKLSIRGGGG